MSNDSCLLSVILVMKNGAAFVGAALESVIHQSRPPDEIIVVDGLSSDESVAIARSFQPSFPRLQVVTQSEPGLAAARNHGMGWLPGG
jgi:glycosyltransferase involved in cell wall biosynthesis